jgi:hypothetical protein
LSQFTGIERITSTGLASCGIDADEYGLVAVSEGAIAVSSSALIAVSESAGNAYVDIVELDEALQLYFLGQLDYVDPTCCNAPLAELIPGRPLLSQLDQESMTIALSRLPQGDSFLIEAVALHKHVDSAYADALLRLSDVIAKTIL